MNSRILLVCTALSLSGCTTVQDVILAPVGPRPPRIQVRLPPSTGDLVVFSATEPGAGAVDSDSTPYSDYDLLAADGTVLKRVRNQSERATDEPARISLLPGRYVVKARGAGRLHATVPVVIELNRTTAVHLDGSSPPNLDQGAPDDVVRTPDGTVVGWRADNVVADNRERR